MGKLSVQSCPVHSTECITAHIAGLLLQRQQLAGISVQQAVVVLFCCCRWHALLLVMDNRPFPDLRHIVRDADDERIQVFAEWVSSQLLEDSEHTYERCQGPNLCRAALFQALTACQCLLLQLIKGGCWVSHFYPHCSN